MTEAPKVALPHTYTVTADPTPAGSAGRADADDFARQDIRLAVVLNGGVSLAIWISGVTLELHHLAMARRWDQTTYRPLLELLQADARIDVIAGTSAGGLNGAFLALGLTRDRDLTLLRDLWRDHGSLEKLLRDPLAKKPPSLLMGDAYFLPVIRDALNRTLRQDAPEASQVHDADWQVELILTGTLWQGRTTSFTDDMGAAITEMDHDARFRFTLSPRAGSAQEDEITSGGLVDQLAAAARCTSSFPAAFEPHFVEVTDEVKVGDGPWTSDAGQANFRDSQFLLDGGILLNKPVRPALEAIYRQTGASQVRRLLAYVVPHPGEPNRAADGDAAADRDPPEARDVLLGILTRLRSTDSVSRELSEIRQRNADAHQRRRVRDRLAAAMTDAADPLSNGAWSAYIEVRIANAARRIGQLLAAGQQQAAGRWSERELVEAVQRQLTQWRADPAAGRFFIPQGELAAALERTGRDWDWGATTVERLGDMAVDVLKRAVWLAPMGSAWQQTIVHTRTDLSATLKRIRDDRRALDDYWSIAPAGSEDAGPIPARQGDALGAATNLAQLQAWLAVVLGGWDRISDPDGDPGGRRAGLHGRALEVATHLQGCADTIAAVAGASDQAQSAIDPEGVERRRLKALYDYLLAPAKPTSMLAAMRRHRRRSAPPTPADVLARLLRLDVVQLAFSGASPEVEQEVELVQVSARQPETLTGVQLHHFGAFYRSSWRMNDWLHGRMDGAAHLVRMLLSTDRLRQRIWGMAGDPGAGHDLGDAGRQLLELIRRCAISTDDPTDLAWLEERWAEVDATTCRRFVELLLAPKPAAVPLRPGREATAAEAHRAGREQELLDACARAITRSAQTRILRDDLPALAEAIRSGGPTAPRPARPGWRRTTPVARPPPATSPPRSSGRCGHGPRRSAGSS